MAGAGSTTVATGAQVPDVQLADLLQRMYKHVLDDYAVPARTEQPFNVGKTDDVDAAASGVMLRHAAHVTKHATLGPNDVAAFVTGKGYLAQNVGEVVGPAYTPASGATAVLFVGVPETDASAPIDVSRVLASQATLKGRLEGLVEDNESAPQGYSAPNLAPYAGIIGAVIVPLAAAIGSVFNKPVTYVAAAIAGGLAGWGIVKLSSKQRATENVLAGEPEEPKQVYTADIGTAVRDHYTNLVKLRDALDVKIKQTSAEMLEKLNRPFDEARAREDYGYLDPQQREAEVGKARTAHLGAQKSVMNALLLYTKVADQIRALEPIVAYKHLQ